jgi:hypothetical protein
MLWTTCRSQPTVHCGPGGAVVALLAGDGCTTAIGLRCSPQLHKKEEVGAVLTDDKRRRRTTDSGLQ